MLAAGPVTCASFYDTGPAHRMVVFSGRSLGGPLRLEAWPHAAVVPEAPVEDLLMRLVRHGLTQHFAVVPGRVAGALEKWSWLAGVEFHEER